MGSDDNTPLTGKLLADLAAQLDRTPISAERGEILAAAYRPILDMIMELRKVPLKDVEPAMVYAPLEKPR